MKNKDLIAKLQQFDPEIEVAILDWAANERGADEEGSSDGIYPGFTISKMAGEEIPEGTKEWIALEFDNDNLFVPAVRKCRVCGCTDDDCRQCIEKTGNACHWVEADLCSACVEEGKDETPGE
ncbi:MAG TPA: hypothetical protein VFE32_17300 [Puia sp.]|jgi:hypothetical protein|nr:hypothetical protein [Puia sp.]